MRMLFAMTALLVVMAFPAKADRPTTEAERAKLMAAISAQRCSGGKMEWDDEDRHFEVDDAVCDGRKYDLKFDAKYRLISKRLDN
ncbi:MAG: hypothetical protein ACRECO_03585 [Xanthobacteraceae bacterium]